MVDTIRIGTRGSDLALYQANLISSLIQKNSPGHTVEIIVIKTSGDEGNRQPASLEDPFETKRMFTREIEQALLDGEVDLAVHSAKDMAVPCPEGLKIAATPVREDPRDCFASGQYHSISQMPEGAVLGTSSLRRKTQAARLNPKVVIRDIRGNVGTRLRKCREGQYDGIILAAAGMKRLGLEHEAVEFFSPQQMLPAPGQGIIAVQIREDDLRMDEILSGINHPETFIRLECERAFLKKLEGGCQLPCGIVTELVSGKIFVKGILLSPLGNRWVEAEYQGDAQNAQEAGLKLAELILEKGGRDILEDLKRSGS
ncbi:MAG: hydroxymethylbilane synthase [Candidatus Omnitrophica bacterium]|nr:hydroxymethylbilane synthase [Candidatus Omnitrophota bacterium]